ncbi:methyltransferase domain-containing protein [Candidatus Woesearchaeota archaeon]|nr:methyltransferase domain-containing protein [Candidatus Woesearchaeota archaeon]
MKIRIDKFHAIKERYSEFYEKNFYAKGKGAVFDTAKGTWGPAGTQDVYELFVKIKLQDYKNFLDLGSGDGKVVLIASLFTNATGIEIDEKLIKVGEKIKKNLNLNKAKFIHGDYLKQDTSKYDFIFINPDQGFHKGIEDKLIKEMNKDAVLFVYNKIFQPRFLKKGKTYWFDGIPIMKYTKSD